MKYHWTLWIIGACGIFLLASPLLNKWRIRWPKTALFIAGLMAECYVTLEIIDHHIGQQDRWYSLVSHLQSMAGGVGIGLLVAFELFDLLDYRRHPQCANPT
jgi:hypothetical protein